MRNIHITDGVQQLGQIYISSTGLSDTVRYTGTGPVYFTQGSPELRPDAAPANTIASFTFNPKHQGQHILLFNWDGSFSGETPAATKFVSVNMHKALKKPDGVHIISLYPNSLKALIGENRLKIAPGRLYTLDVKKNERGSAMTVLVEDVADQMKVKYQGMTYLGGERAALLFFYKDDRSINDLKLHKIFLRPGELGWKPKTKTE